MHSKNLDALIAEKVFGWKNLRIETRGEGSIGNYYEYPVLVGDSPCNTDDDVVPPYSTNMEYAWQVVESLRDDYEAHGGFSFGMWTVVSISSVMWGTEAAFIRSTYPPSRDKVDGQFRCRAETAPEAICLAALKALQQAYPRHVGETI